MGIYNRARVLLMDPSLKIRDSDSARAKYDAVLGPLGGYYCGYQSHHYSGPTPAHFYMIDDPSDAVLAQLLLWAERTPGYPLKLFREYIGHDNVELSFNNILGDVAKILEKDFIEEESPLADSNAVARCWSGVKVLALAAGAGRA